MAKHYPMYLGGKWVTGKNKIRVENPYDDKLVGTVSSATSADFTKAISIAQETFKITRELPCYAREKTCLQIAESLEKKADKFAKMMVAELGKSLKESKAEIVRAIGVFRVAAEEAKRIGGEIIDLDWNPGAEERLGLVRRFPMGVVAGIAPFNFPLNLIAHKIAPAIASGNCIVIKPASKTPIIALMLAELIDQTDHPKGAISILPAPAKETTPLLKDPRVKLITFTGSSEVGWWIKQNAERKEVVLELGGNAGMVVADDADINFAVTRLLYGAFGVAGQSCISVQRVFVHEKVYNKFLRLFKQKTAKLKVGNPSNPKTDIGTLVDTESIKNTKAVLESAVADGAKIVMGNKYRKRQMYPTILTNVKPSMAVCCKEAFAPYCVITKYKSFKKVIDQINDSTFGLQAGIFTNRLLDIFYAYKHIECGGVVINDIPSFRADHQPYGGMKESGVGREGIKYAIEDMTEVKILSMNLKR